MREVILLSETLIIKGKITGELILKRYSGADGKYCIEFDTAEEFDLPLWFRDKIKLMHAQYRERLSKAKKRICANVNSEYFVFEIWYDVYEKFYEKIKRLLINYFDTQSSQK